MRFSLILNPTKEETTIPINYQYPLQAYIYKVLEKGNEKYAEWLHNNGFAGGNNKFYKLFCYSNLIIKHGFFSIDGDRLKIRRSPVELQIGFVAEKAVESFITGIFSNQKVKIYDKLSEGTFETQSITKQPEPNFNETMRYRTLSPVLVSQTVENGYAQYLSPDNSLYESLLTNNLMRKYLAIGNNEQLEIIEPKFTLLNTPKRKKITIKNDSKSPVHLVAYMYEFEFTASKMLHKIIYNGGLGEKNSAGFGFVEILI